MKNTMFLPVTIDLGHSEKYVLSIRILADKFMFSISDPGNRKNYCLRETSFPAGTSLVENIKRIIFDFNFLTQQYLQTDVIIVSPEYSLVPEEYFIQNQREEMYKFVRSGDSGHILFNKNPGQGDIVIYNIDSELFEFLSRNLYDPQFYHHTDLLITYFEVQVKEVSPRMFVCFHDRMFDVMCYSGMKIEHCLSYTDDSPANQAYYILKVWENSGLNQLHDTLYLAGEVDEVVMSILQKYIKKIERIGAFSDVYLWHEDAQKAPLDMLALSI